MLTNHAGELFAFLTAVCWTIGPLAFESAARKVGSLAVNLLRLFLAFILLSLYSGLTRGLFFPGDASGHAWFWLFLSGLVGFVIGDLFLLKAFATIGSRISMLVMSLAPPITALLGWLVLGEILTWKHITGMAVTLAGIAWVILGHQAEDRRSDVSEEKQMGFSFLPRGVLYALGGAGGQAVGLILSKTGMQNYNAFAATQIRVLAGICGFTLIFFVFRRWPGMATALKNRRALAAISIGSFFGPFLGVSFSLLAIQKTKTGIASTIMALVPILIIAPSALIHHERVRLREVLGAVVAVVGVAILVI